MQEKEPSSKELTSQLVIKFMTKTWRFETESGATSAVPVSVLASLATASISTLIQCEIRPDSFNCPILVVNLQGKLLQSRGQFRVVLESSKLGNQHSAVQ